MFKNAPDKLLDLATVLLFVFMRPIQALMHRFSRVGDREFFTSNSFPWVAAVEARWPAIRTELDNVLRFKDDLPNFQDISAENRVITNDDKWRTFFFIAWGIEIDSNCARCPITADVLRNIPGMKSALFSIMLPHKYLPPHRGPYAGVLRYHLGLIVPDAERCRIRVGDKTSHWHEGESMIFDDTFEHEVWNDSDGIRVVLFVDIVRPLPFPLAQINMLIIRMISKSSLVQPGLKKFRYWDARLAKVWSKLAEGA